MSAAVAGASYSPPSPFSHSSDTQSPVFPDRPIRPLPKRPLRSRLSSDVADSILHPHTPSISHPQFYAPYNEAVYYGNGARNGSGTAITGKISVEAQKAVSKEDRHGYQFKGGELDSDDEDRLRIIRRYDIQRQGAMSTSSRGPTNGVSRACNPLSQSQISSGDSVDGYDSFENTNNKKKRKIPTSGSLGNHHSSLSTEMANMGLSAAHDIDGLQSDTDGGVVQYYGSGSSAVPSVVSGTGISGAGRGRYGRSGRRNASGRSPLGLSTNGSNAWQAGRLGGLRRDYTPTGTFSSKASDQLSDHGIISAAIAEAAALPITYSKGKENISLLEQQVTKNPSRAKTQFTFTCESDSTKGVIWPGTPKLAPGPSYQPLPVPGSAASFSVQSQKGFSTQGTQTSPTMAGQGNQNGARPVAMGHLAPQNAKKPKRPAGKRYTIAAGERRLHQEYNNYHHPPDEKDMWICEFCEYESIFGSPPEALVRQYEIKDRKDRKRQDDKRRLLEKAKMKGRKGKKGNRNTNRAANVAGQLQTSAGQPTYQPPPTEAARVQHHGTQSEDYFGDDYDDDPVSMPAPPLRTPTRIPQPIPKQYHSSLRSAHATEMDNSRDGGGDRTARL